MNVSTYAGELLAGVGVIVVFVLLAYRMTRKSKKNPYGDPSVRVMMGANQKPDQKEN